MIDLEPLIVSELEQMFPLPDGSRADWTNVLQRAGLGRARRRQPSRRLTLVLAAAVIVGLAVAVPASGLSQTVISWFSAAPAPRSAQKDFHELDVGAPAGMAPGVSGPARSVVAAQIDGKTVHFWVAPTASGGFCLELEGYGGGCDRNRQLPIAWISAGHNGHAVVFGDALSSEVDHVELSFASGESFAIPIVYVSDPINASFFVYELPYTAAGPHPDGPGTLEAVRGDGSVIASQTVGPFFVAPMTAPNG